jgi:hypothetical protein
VPLDSVDSKRVITWEGYTAQQHFSATSLNTLIQMVLGDLGTTLIPEMAIEVLVDRAIAIATAMCNVDFFIIIVSSVNIKKKPRSKNVVLILNRIRWGQASIMLQNLRSLILRR